MIFLKEVSHGEMYPRFYRPCWFDVIRGRKMCAPIGLNLLFMLGRWLWEWSYWCSISRREAEMLQAYQKGVDDERNRHEQSIENAVNSRFERTLRVMKNGHKQNTS